MDSSELRQALFSSRLSRRCGSDTLFDFKPQRFRSHRSSCYSIGSRVARDDACATSAVKAIRCAKAEEIIEVLGTPHHGGAYWLGDGGRPVNFL
jgi:hypothetical protein